MRGGLARVSGRFDRRQHADTHRPEQISFKIDSTDKTCYRADLPTPVTVKEGPPKGRSSRSHTLVHTVLLCLVLGDYPLLRSGVTEGIPHFYLQGDLL